MAEDILGAIARARADMLMRGRDLVGLDGRRQVEIGPLTLQRLQREFVTGYPPDVFGMPILVREDREGFAVVPMQGPV